jgi:hypothetical protein
MLSTLWSTFLTWLGNLLLPGAGGVITPTLSAGATAMGKAVVDDTFAAIEAPPKPVGVLDAQPMPGQAQVNAQISALQKAGLQIVALALAIQAAGCGQAPVVVVQPGISVELLEPSPRPMKCAALVKLPDGSTTKQVIYETLPAGSYDTTPPTQGIP